MGLTTKIEWSNCTANLWQGCARVHEGCLHCYAAASSKRYGHDLWGNDKPRWKILSTMRNLEKSQKRAMEEKKIYRVFVGSMMDIFEKPMPLVDQDGDPLSISTDDLRQRLFKNIDNNMYPNLDFLMLTKRPSNINKYIPDAWKQQPPPNVMFGTSPVNQATANILIRQLAQVKGRRFLSVEPQLERLTLLPWLQAGILDWVIVGGESGPGKRPFNTDWGRQLRDECKVTNVPFFFKQVDGVKVIPADLMVREYYASYDNNPSSRGIEEGSLLWPTKSLQIV